MWYTLMYKYNNNSLTTILLRAFTVYVFNLWCSKRWFPRQSLVIRKAFRRFFVSSPSCGCNGKHCFSCHRHPAELLEHQQSKRRKTVLWNKVDDKRAHFPTWRRAFGTVGSFVLLTPSSVFFVNIPNKQNRRRIWCKIRTVSQAMNVVPVVERLHKHVVNAKGEPFDKFTAVL